MSLYSQALLDVHDWISVDMFAGGGGVGAGFEEATGRQVDIAINHNRTALEMHKANHPQTHHLHSDVFEVCPKEAVKGRHLAFLWGSPDCTDFSKAKGDAPLRSPSMKRRALANVLLRWAGQTKPDVIMLENVEEFTGWTRLVAKRDKATGRVLKIDGTVAAKGEHVPLELQFLTRDKKSLGRRFKNWVKFLRNLGYQVEWRELRACDYGAPTIRKRLFVIARRDGLPIVWPIPTHGNPQSEAVKSGKLLPWRSTASCIDWNTPMCSIFATKEEARAWAKFHGVGVPQRPLADNTDRRIARGVYRFVLESKTPFFIQVGENPLAPFNTQIAHSQKGKNGSQRWGDGTRSLQDPHTTITAKSEVAITAACLVPRYGERPGQSPRSRSVESPSPVVVPDGNGASLVGINLQVYHSQEPGSERVASVTDPSPTLDTSNRVGICASFLGQNNGGFYEGCGHEVTDPLSTINTNDRGKHALFGIHIGQHFGGFAEGNSGDGRSIEEPLSTISTKGPHQSIVATTLIDQHGTGEGVDPAKPSRTVSAKGNHHMLAAAHIERDFGQSVGSDISAPIGTLTGTGNGKAALVYSFLSKFYGTSIGQSVEDPLHTVTTKDRMGFVTVRVEKTHRIPTSWGEMVVLELGDYVITDICMRMLTPRELFRCQGFRDSYIIDRGADGRKITRTDQVHMCGNSVPPPFVKALVQANCPYLIVRQPKVTKQPKKQQLKELVA